MIRKTAGKQRPLRVSFSGIDGAGKSTQIEMLRARLMASGARVQLVTFWDDVAVLPRLREKATHALFKGEEGIGTPEQPVNRRDKNVRSWYMTGMRFGLYFLEAISLLTAAARKRDADVLIFDRYLFDQLANLPMQRFFTRVYARLLLKLVPPLDIAYLLDADPDQARARKPEYPIEFLHDLRVSYAVLNRIGRMTRVAPGSVEEVSEAITESFLRKCPQIEMKEWVGGIPEPRSSEQRA